MRNRRKCANRSSYRIENPMALWLKVLKNMVGPTELESVTSTVSR
jgi:hypothetical protein